MMEVQTIVHLDSFITSARQAGVSAEEYDDIVDFVALNPMAGDLIPGSGGARKVRIAGKGKGKSGGYRVVTYYIANDAPVYLIGVYAKAQLSDIPARELPKIKAIAKALLAKYRKE